MVTGFNLEPAYVYTNSQEVTPEKIQEIATIVGKDQKKLYEKCLEYGLKEELSCGCKLSELLKRYENIPTEDLTCYFTEFGVQQSASSGTGHRMVREQICRAFGILVLDYAYKQGYSISFTIT